MQDILPKIDPKQLCEVLQLCSLRRQNDINMLVIKKLDKTSYETPLSEIANENIYMWDKIIITYSSWHVFISDDMRQVFLVTVSKNGNTQIHFTWWSPLEEKWKDIIVNDNDIIKLNIMKIEDNATLRTYNRTWVEVIESYNEIPTVDRMMQEKIDNDWNKFWSLVLLMSFVVKFYKWNLWYKFAENVIDGKRYDIDKLSQNPLIASNISIVTARALQIINQYK